MAEELAAELDGEDELTGGDHDEHPALRAETLALGVSDVGVELAGGRRRHEADHQDSGDTDRVFCRQWEDVLHEERIQFNHLPKGDNVTIQSPNYLNISTCQMHMKSETAMRRI